MKYRVLILASLWLAHAAVADDSSGYALGVGLAVDNGDGMTGTVIGNLFINDHLLLSADYASTQADAAPDDIQTRDWSLGASYDFGPIGFEAYGGQSGDPDDFDAEDLSFGVFHLGEHWRLSARYLQRDIDLILRTPNLDRVADVSIPLEADGWRLGVGYKTEGGVRLNVSSRWFDYDRDITLLSNFVIVRRLSPTSLTLATSLLDRSTVASVEWPLRNSRSINLSVARDVLAGDLGEAETLSLGFTTPVGASGDLDISAGVSEGSSGIEGSTVFLNVFYLFFGIFE